MHTDDRRGITAHEFCKRLKGMAVFTNSDSPRFAAPNPRVTKSSAYDLVTQESRLDNRFHAARRAHQYDIRTLV